MEFTAVPADVVLDELLRSGGGASADIKAHIPPTLTPEKKDVAAAVVVKREVFADGDDGDDGGRGPGGEGGGSGGGGSGSGKGQGVGVRVKEEPRDEGEFDGGGEGSWTKSQAGADQQMQAQRLQVPAAREKASGNLKGKRKRVQGPPVVQVKKEPLEGEDVEEEKARKEEAGNLKEVKGVKRGAGMATSANSGGGNPRSTGSSSNIRAAKKVKAESNGDAGGDIKASISSPTGTGSPDATTTTPNEKPPSSDPKSLDDPALGTLLLTLRETESRSWKEVIQTIQTQGWPAATVKVLSRRLDFAKERSVTWSSEEKALLARVVEEVEREWERQGGGKWEKVAGRLEEMGVRKPPQACRRMVVGGKKGALRGVGGGGAAGVKGEEE